MRSGDTIIGNANPGSEHSHHTPTRPCPVVKSSRHPGPLIPRFPPARNFSCCLPSHHAAPCTLARGTRHETCLLRHSVLIAWEPSLPSGILNCHVSSSAWASIARHRLPSAFAICGRARASCRDLPRFGVCPDPILQPVARPNPGRPAHPHLPVPRSILFLTGLLSLSHTCQSLQATRAWGLPLQAGAGSETIQGDAAP